MLTNEEVIRKFYTAFQQKEFKTMQELYADTASFQDPAFQHLNANEVKAMWQMLLTRGKDLQLEYKNVQTTPEGGSANWIATYTFSLTGRKVVNNIEAVFTIKDGKITTHSDHFNFYHWAKQAFGWKGYLLGFTGFFRKKVQENARKNLLAFMAKNNFNIA